MFYFAYGSNTLWEQMHERIGKCKIVGKAELHNYELCFQINKNYKTVANIIPSKDCIVYGVIYDLSKEQEKMLDYFEGFPTIYERKIKKIISKNKNVFCTVYVLTENYGFDLPEYDYFLKIKKGFFENKIDFISLEKSYGKGIVPNKYDIHD
jgi:gamma-glutamylcyclotransferase (GGCT)/AIG2-like uncharacterized protein YtfP